MARVRRDAATAQAAETRTAIDQYAAFGEAFDGIGWRQADRVITEVRAVPTWFVQVDAVTAVGGWPTDRFTLLHGPSNQGKTSFLLGLFGSYLERGHFAAFMDAERSTPKLWAQQMMGPFFGHPGFRAFEPATFEAARDAVRAWAETIGTLRAKGKIDPQTTGIIGLDSIRKLVPKKLFDKLAKESADEDEDPKGKGRGRKKPGGIDGAGGRAAQIKAALNTAWMDELTHVLKQCGVGMVAVAREYENSDKGPMDFGEPDFKLGGGQGLFFESSLVVRVAGKYAITVGEDKDRTLVGERHRVEVWKTKIGEKRQRIPKAFFHTFAGGSGEGFDRARDLHEMALECGLLTQGGSWFSYGGVKLGQGEENAIKRLREDRDLAAEIERELRKSFVPAGADKAEAQAPEAQAPEVLKPAARGRSPKKRAS